MVDWTKSMQQTFEYYVVDPGTWKDVKRLTDVKSCTISWDSDADTLGSATIDINESLGESYIRVYMITVQNGITEKHPLGTFLVQTPSSSFDGKVRSVSMDAYTPLLELKENQPPLGYSLLKGDNIMEKAYQIVRENARAPVVKADCEDALTRDFVSDPDNDTWITFVSDLIANAKYELALDEMGRILFSPKQDTASLQPVRTFDDGNSSILLPDVTIRHDIYGIPNVVEVTYSDGIDHYHARVVNDDPNSPTSVISRGREIIYRITNPNMNNGIPTQQQIDRYAEQALRDLSSVSYSVSFKHGYCGTRIGDCVRLNYDKAGLRDVKGKIITQSIKCEEGCSVTEKVIFTNNLWR